MMEHDDKNHDDNLDLERAKLLQESSKEMEDLPMCGFLSVKYYQPYFDIETTDIQQRILHSTFFCRREQNFIGFIESKPDAYGPFWIATTLIFIIAVTSHMNGWLSSWMKGAQWQYNFQSILSACSIIYGFLFFVTSAVWFVFRQYEPKLRFITVFCLYGYSFFNFIPAALLCLLPSPLVSWIALGLAFIASSIFLMRNLTPYIVQQNPQHVAIILGILGCIQFALALTIKLTFFMEK